MSSGICEGIQTCFDPLLVQPHVVGLALFSFMQPSFPSPASSGSLPPVGFAMRQDYGGIVCPVMCRDDQAYVHPLIGRSAAVLSDESLEMCTESLGNETGSGGFLGEDDEGEKSQMCQIGRELKCRKGNRSRPCDFPPPLKSMSGSSMVRMQPYRGDGRLVLQAVDVSSCHGSFLIERGGGRLRLSICREQDTKEDNVEEEGARASNEGEGREAEDEEGEGSYETGKAEEKVGCRRQPGRCKEGSPLNWKPRWVAT